MIEDPKEYGRYTKSIKKVEAWKWRPHDTTRGMDGLHFMTVLSLDRKAEERMITGKNGEPVRKTFQSSDTKYAGPFYFDVDNDSLAKSIKTINKVVKMLVAYGTPPEYIRVWASGQKGFHLTIPQEAVADLKGYVKLPKIYEALAQKIGKDISGGIDWGVYSAGQGRMWRLPGCVRENGRYKVPVSLEELEHMTPDEYEEITSEPREEFPDPVVTEKVKTLADLFEWSKTQIEAKKDIIPVFLDPETRGLMEDQPNGLPPCANSLMQGPANVRERNHGGFNAAGIQFGKAVAAWNPDKVDELVEAFCWKYPESREESQEDRVSHVMGVYRKSASQEGYEWSCRTMISVLKAGDTLCDECPAVHLLHEDDYGHEDEVYSAPRVNGTNGSHNKSVEGMQLQAEPGAEEVTEVDTSRPPDEALPDLDDQEEEEAEEDAAEASAPEVYKDPLKFDTDGVITLSEGKCERFAGKDGSEEICNFSFNIKQIMVEWMPEFEEYRRTGTKADIVVGEIGEKRERGLIMLSDESWSSKSNLIKAIGRVSNASYFGKDEEVQRMKRLTYGKIRDLDRIPDTIKVVKQVRACGIHYEKVTDKDVFTYVETSWSIDNFGNENSYAISGSPPVKLELKRAPELDLEAAKQIFENVFALNEEVVVAQQFGYYMACFLKTHLVQIRREFPILGGHGNRGSGKTQGNLRMISALHGVDYFGADTEINLPNITAFPLWSAMTGSTTVPLILDEFNKSKFTPSSKHTQFGEYFKQAWQLGAVMRGGLSKNDGRSRSELGAESTSYPLTAPITVLSEQEVEMPALVQRMIQVSIRPSGINNEARQAFTTLQKLKDQSRALAKQTNLLVINTKISQVNEWLEEAYKGVPIDMGDRPHLAFSVLKVGFYFAEHLCKVLKIDAVDLIRKYHSILDTYLLEHGAEIVESKTRSETDLVLDAMATLAALQSDDTASQKLLIGIHYIIEGDTLYLDALTAHSVYLKYCRAVVGVQPVIESIHQFRGLLVQEPYCHSVTARVLDFASNRQCVQLSLSKMQEKGIESEGFKYVE